MAKSRDPHDDIQYSPFTLIVKLREKTAPEQVAKLMSGLGTVVLIDWESNLYGLVIYPGSDIEDVRRKCSELSEVESAERCIRHRI